MTNLGTMRDRSLAHLCLTLLTTILISSNLFAGITAQITALELRSGNDLVGFAPLSLSVAFDPNTTSYTAAIPFEHSKVLVETVTAQPGYTVPLPTIPSFDPEVPVDIVFEVLVDNPFSDPVVANTYTVTITRGAPNSIAALSDLAISGVGIPSFDGLTFSYEPKVAFSTSSVTITPTTPEAEAGTITVNGVVVVSGNPSSPIPLAVGVEKTITILSTSSAGTVTKAYQLFITRLDQDSDADGQDDFWEHQNGLNIGVDDSLLDKDRDGLVNILEYAFGSDPGNPSDTGSPEVFASASGFATISFFKAVTDGTIIYTPQACDPSTSPTWTNDLSDQTLEGSPQNQIWQDNAGGSSTLPASRWLRVKVTSNP